MSRETAPRVATSPERVHEERSRSALLLLLLGGGFFLIGCVDSLLLWIPTRFSSVAWEFATVGRTLDGLPMPALGLGLMTYGAVRHPRMGRSWMRAFGILFGVSAMLLVMAAILFATSAPAVLTSTPSEAVEGVRRAVFRHGFQAVIYPVVMASIAALMWRGGRE
jgi:hypothetical protein